MRATKRRRPTPGRSKASPANRPDHVSEPSYALKNLLPGAKWATPSFTFQTVPSIIVRTLSMMVANLLTPTQREILGKLTSVAIADTLTVLVVQLQRFAKDPTLVTDSIEWEKFITTRDWIWTHILNPGTPDNGNNIHVATLISVLRDCPCDLGKTIQDFVSEHETAVTHCPHLRIVAEGLAEKRGLMGFCRSHDLFDWLAELVLNARRHNEHAPGADTITVTIDLEDKDAFFEIIVSNDGRPKPATKPGRGLTLCRAGVEAFSGTLRSPEKNQLQAGEPFKVTISLPKVT